MKDFDQKSDFREKRSLIDFLRFSIFSFFNFKASKTLNVVQNIKMPLKSENKKIDF